MGTTLKCVDCGKPRPKAGTSFCDGCLDARRSVRGAKPLQPKKPVAKEQWRRIHPPEISEFHRTGIPVRRTFAKQFLGVNKRWHAFEIALEATPIWRVRGGLSYRTVPNHALPKECLPSLARALNAHGPMVFAVGRVYVSAAWVDVKRGYAEGQYSTGEKWAQMGVLYVVAYCARPCVRCQRTVRCSISHYAETPRRREWAVYPEHEDELGAPLCRLCARDDDCATSMIRELSTRAGTVRMLKAAESAMNGKPTYMEVRYGKERVKRATRRLLSRGA